MVRLNRTGNRTETIGLSTLVKLWLAILLVCAAQVRNGFAAEEEVDHKLTKADSESPLVMLGNPEQNSIPLLNNRFRIDYNVEKITMVFFREFGSPPVVLVRPDGSKLYSTKADDDMLTWHDDTNYDMIVIKKPMPGPWQAVGNILPQSRVMVLTEIQLHADPLPSLLFAGERIKQTAYLTNGGKPIDYNEFNDVVTLDIRFVSTNNSDFENFGAPNANVGQFRDDGINNDERPRDGKFTAEFNLDLAPGEWRPEYKVETPLYIREIILNPIILSKNPVKISMEVSESSQEVLRRPVKDWKPHKFVFDVERELVDIESILLDGRVTYPNGEQRHFSVTQVTDKPRVIEVPAEQYGVYKVNAYAFGKTINGRDFRLLMPETVFLVEEPEEPPPTEEELQRLKALEAANEALRAQQALAEQVQVEEVVEEEGMDRGTLMTIVIGINVTLLLVGGIVIYFFVLGKNMPKFNFLKKGAAKKESSSKKGEEKQSSKDDDDEDMLGMGLR